MTQPPLGHPSTIYQSTPSKPPAPTGTPTGTETTLGRPLAWAAAWGGLGALGVVGASVTAFNVFLTVLFAVTTEETTAAEILPSIWQPAADFLTNGSTVVLRICAVTSLTSMAALLVLRRRTQFKRTRPGMQGLIAAVAAYAFYSVAGPVLGTMFLAIAGRA